MIINIIGHGLQWGENVKEETQWRDADIPLAPHFNSVSFYCHAGEGFDGPDAHLIVNGEWHNFVQEINDIHHIPEHFVFPNQGAWNDILPRVSNNPRNHIPPGLNDPHHYGLLNVVHQIDGIEILRLRQIVRPNNPFPESQLVISPINETCISLSWLINNIPLIIDAHPELAALPNHDNYTYRWLVCRDLIAGLNPHDNAASLVIIDDAAQEASQRIDRLLWGL
jgi:hypothetical protein